MPATWAASATDAVDSNAAIAASRRRVYFWPCPIICDRLRSLGLGLQRVKHGAKRLDDFPFAVRLAMARRISVSSSGPSTLRPY